MTSTDDSSKYETKRLFHARFAFLQQRRGVTATDSFARSLRWLHKRETERERAVIKGTDVDELMERCRASGVFTEAIRLAGTVFGDPEKLGTCFPLRPDDAIECLDEEDDFSGFDWAEAKRAVEVLMSSQSQGVINALGHAMRSLCAQLMASFPGAKKGDGKLRAFVVGFEIAELAARLSTKQDHEQVNYAELARTDSAQLMQTMLSAPASSKLELFRFMKQTWGFSGSVERLNNALSFAVEKTRLFTFNTVAVVMEFLREFFFENECIMPESNRLPRDVFVNRKLAKYAAEDDEFLNADFLTWWKTYVPKELEKEYDFSWWKPSTPQDPPPKCFVQVPWVLDTAAKSHVLQIVQEIGQQASFQNTVRDSILTMSQESPYLVLRVRRDRLVDDAVSQLAQTAKANYRKPLKVQFVGEEGVDAGGVRKEFFLLMMRQLLDASFGMFSVQADGRSLWFNPDSYESNVQFELVGALMGLAIANRVILDVSFSPALYAMLLAKDETVSFKDLKFLDPTLYAGLESLMNFEGDVESTFCRTFQASRESWGAMTTFDLAPNGANIPVTNENRCEFVNAYARWALMGAVRSQLEAFKRGFSSVITLDVLHTLLLTPAEMELLVVGETKALDFAALEKSARYDDGFDPESETVLIFWRVANELNEIDKRKFLKFITGSDRVPIRGLSDVHLVISRAGPDSDRLPSAHTCFDHLLLPDYKNEQKLREKLRIALLHSEGFGSM